MGFTHYLEYLPTVTLMTSAQTDVVVCEEVVVARVGFGRRLVTGHQPVVLKKLGEKIVTKRIQAGL